MTELQEVAARFESLGGGCLASATGGLGFGCEFGFFQRHVGIEPLGLLRWAGIGATDLILALDSDFAGIDDPKQLQLLDRNTGGGWAYMQKTYNLRNDHTGMLVKDVSEEDARQKNQQAPWFLAA